MHRFSDCWMGGVPHGVESAMQIRIKSREERVEALLSSTHLELNGAPSG